MSNCKTYAVDASGQFLGDGGATVCGFIPTNSDSDAILASVSGWKPNGGSHPTAMFVKRTVEGNKAGIWFRVNFVNDAPNGRTWITFFQGGQPSWPNAVVPTSTTFDAPPWH